MWVEAAVEVAAIVVNAIVASRRNKVFVFMRLVCWVLEEVFS